VTALRFVEDDLMGPEILALLEAHLAHSAASTPDGFRFALDLDGLKGPDMTFWSAWDSDGLAGCVALKALDGEAGEVKSMHTAASRRRQGVGSRLVEHVVAVAQARGYGALYLETGKDEGYAPARALYQSHGFEPCGPFGDYRDSPYNTFFKLDL